MIKSVLVTGGAGYVGSILVPKLLDKGYKVKVLDLYLFGRDVLDSVKDNPNLIQIKGDIRDKALLEKIIPGIDAVIHLACISNDPSFELDPMLGKSINYDPFPILVSISKENIVKRFIYASSSSVYGVKQEENVTEDLPLEPLTDYSRFKALCEPILLREKSEDFVPVVIRSATVCGYSPRQRLDLTVNILTNNAVNAGKIKVFGGEQKRPNIHIQDITDLYIKLLEYPEDLISGKIFNVGFENHKVKEIAQMVKKVVNRGDLQMETLPTDDNRSYHISSEKIRRELGFEPRHTIEDAISDLCNAFREGKIPDPMNNIRWYNIKTMLAKKIE